MFLLTGYSQLPKDAYTGTTKRGKKQFTDSNHILVYLKLRHRWLMYTRVLKTSEYTPSTTVLCPLLTRGTLETNKIDKGP